MTHPIDAWHELAQARNPRALKALLAEDVVFHSPVVHTPQRGRALATQYLSAALAVLGNDSFHYVREIRGERDALLEFELELALMLELEELEEEELPKNFWVIFKIKIKINLFCDSLMKF